MKINTVIGLLMSFNNYKYSSRSKKDLNKLLINKKFYYIK
jgi:hypothetical protein